MKKTTALYIGFILFLCKTSFGTVYIANNNYNAPAGQYPTITAAMAAASPNDTIYVLGSPTNYDYVSPVKSLTFIGAGYRPQKDFNFPSNVPGFGFPSLAGDGCKMFGFNIGGIDVQNGGGNNLEIAYNISLVQFFTGSDGIYKAGNNCNIHDNIFNVQFASSIEIRGSNTLLHNNIFTSANNYNEYIHTAFGPYNNNMIYNNLFLSSSGGYVFTNIEGFTVANNIFYGFAIADTSQSYIPVNCNFSNNLTFNASNNNILFGSNYSSSGINYVGVNPQFVNPTPTFVFDFPPYDFSLQTGSVGHNGGTDLTDIGPFGGLNPFNNFTGMQNIPVVKKLDIINPITGVSDPLQIHVKATNK
jgi:hypothetical protein